MDLPAIVRSQRHGQRRRHGNVHIVYINIVISILAAIFIDEQFDSNFLSNIIFKVNILVDDSI